MVVSKSHFINKFKQYDLDYIAFVPDPVEILTLSKV